MQDLFKLSVVIDLNKNFEDGDKLTLDSFDILAQLGKGSFGKVYKVSSLKSNELYALKVMSQNQITRLKLWPQLGNEIKILAICDHPNIIKLNAVFHDHKNVFLLLELANGKTLFNKLKNIKKFSEEETVNLMTDAIRAIEYLHSKDPPILHRDIKPENILFHKNTLKIADFGWSNRNDAFRNTFCGTPDYLSPEMIKGTGHDEKLDIWTLGILMYELLHGKPPFSPKNKIKDRRMFQKKVEENILKGNIILSSKLSMEVKISIKTLLAPDPDKRPLAKDIFKL